MKIADYKTGDNVLIKMMNIKTNVEEWRKAEVIDKRTIYPSKGSRHRPYPILIVRVMRTYCKATPQYTFIGNIPIFMKNNLQFYDKMNEEGILNKDEIKLDNQ